MAVVLSGMLVSGVVGALATSFNVFNNSVAIVAESTDAEVITTLLIRDAQSAGGLDVTTMQTDATLGVSLTDAAGCAPAGTVVVRFSWLDAVDLRRRVATYARTPANELVRRFCVEGSSPSDAIVGTKVRSAAATCAPVADCTGSPTSIALDVRGIGPDSFAFTVRGTLRSRPRVTALRGATEALTAFGGPDGSAACPSVDVGNRAVVNVAGNVIAGPICRRGPIGGTAGNLRAARVDTVATLADPFGTLPLPTFTCGGRAADPTPVGRNAGSPTVYRRRVIITAATVFQPGEYVFCDGLDVQRDVRVSGTGVLWYLEGNGSQIRGAVDITPATSGPRSGIAVWASTALTVVPSREVTSIRGTIYAPNDELRFDVGDVPLNIGSIVARAVGFQGAGSLRIGVVPNITLSPSTLPSGTVGAAYRDTSMVAGGATSPVRWSADGLPSGVGIDPSTGRISGTPTRAGTSDVVVVAVDATGAAASVRMPLVVNTPPRIESSALPNWTLGQPILTPALVASGGVTPYQWSAAALPPGVMIDATNGSLLGTPSQAGTFAVDVQVLDASGAAVRRTLSTTINPVPSVPVLSFAIPQRTRFANVPLVVGGTPVLTWYVTAPPPWLTFNPDGTISGRAPTGVQTVTFDIGIVDASGAILDATTIIIDIV